MKLLGAIILAAFPAFCIGLQCLQCYHLWPQVPNEDSTNFPKCRDADTVYLQDCDEWNIIPIPIPSQSRLLKGMEMITSRLAHSVRLQEQEKEKYINDPTKNVTQAKEYSCASLVGAGYGVNGAYRGCVTKVQDLCESGGQLSSVELCFCNTNGCNNHLVRSRINETAPGGSGSSSLSSFALALAVLYSISRISSL